MKKIFTLIAVAAMALTANAQGKYAMTEGETHVFSDKVSSVANCTLVFGDADNAVVDLDGAIDFDALGRRLVVAVVAV